MLARFQCGLHRNVQFVTFVLWGYCFYLLSVRNRISCSASWLTIALLSYWLHSNKSCKIQDALRHLASIDLIDLCNEAKVERCRASRDLRSCGRLVECVLNSCGHASLCAECSQRCENCPICRVSLPKNGNILRLRLYYECVEAGLIPKDYNDRSPGKEDGEKHLTADVQRLYSLFDVAMENNLCCLISHCIHQYDLLPFS